MDMADDNFMTNRTQQYGGNSSSFSDQVALLPKLKTKAKDNAKSVSLFWERDQSKLCTSTSSIFFALSQSSFHLSLSSNNL